MRGFAILTLVLIALVVLSIVGYASAAEPAPQQGGPVRRILRAPEQPGQPARNVLRRAWRARPGIVFPHERPQ